MRVVYVRAVTAAHALNLRNDIDQTVASVELVVIFGAYADTHSLWVINKKVAVEGCVCRIHFQYNNVLAFITGVSSEPFLNLSKVFPNQF